MKKILLASALLLGVPAITTTFTSCGVLKMSGGNSIHAIDRIANAAVTATQISNILGNTLELNSNQKSSVLSTFQNYIGQTNSIASLFSSNKSSYLSQLTNFNKGTLGKLQGIMTAAQYAKLLGLGGKHSSANSLFGNLTGGNSMSNDAKSVLGGLLLNSL